MWRGLGVEKSCFWGLPALAVSLWRYGSLLSKNLTTTQAPEGGRGWVTRPFSWLGEGSVAQKSAMAPSRQIAVMCLD